MAHPTYEPIIGLEVHVQLNTNTKLFCGCRAEFGLDPNSAVCPVCLGLPGSLPVLNRQVVEFATRVALALNLTIAPKSKFDRKHYFYPDLPKGFQISQYDEPFCRNGRLETLLDGEPFSVRIHRIHIEEDAGKLMHDPRTGASLVDLNRAGTPLLEIVSEPEIYSPEQAQAYLVALKSIIRYVGVSECNMEQGSLRCDANISLRPAGASTLGTKTEIKNLNSFKAVKDALAYEIQRQGQVLGQGGRITQETRLWDADRGLTIPMRSKEEANDYRYFPEPDLPPLEVSPADVERARASLPELPTARRQRFMDDYGLPAYDAGVLTAEASLAAYYEAAVAHAAEQPKKIANWVMTELLSRINPEKLRADDYPVRPEHLAELVRLVEEGRITGRTAKDVFPRMVETGRSPAVIVQEEGLVQIADTDSLTPVIGEVLEEQSAVVQQWLSGKETALNFLKGQVMRKTRGQANPQAVDAVLREQLERLRATA